MIGDLDFGLAAQGEAIGGSIRIDPQTGTRTVSGGLVSVSGSSFSATMRLTGEPFARVRIDLPVMTQMNASHGGKAEILDLVADVPSLAALDANGQLDVHFAGRFFLTRADDGDFHGRIQITAVYE